MDDREVEARPSSWLTMWMAEYTLRATEEKQRHLDAQAEATRPKHGSMIRKGRR